HDPIDRMTFMDWLGSDLDTTYRYDEASGLFPKRRLTSISRPGSTIAYQYDHFGRVTQDGALALTYDANGNRRTINYSPTIGLCYDYDALDRPIALRYTASGADPCTGSTLVSSASYLPSGPLTSLALGNGLTETRLFDARYYPDRIQVPSRLDWDYTVDAVGNPTGIVNTQPPPLPVENRAFGYQGYQYFLTSATGPWAGLSWTYDKIGNRLSESQAGEMPPFSYSYLQNGTGGNTPKLTQIQPRPHGNGTGSITQTYDSAGNQITSQSAGQEGSGRTSTLTYSAESKLSGLFESSGVASTALLYDGRGFLRDALLTFGASGNFEHTEPTYSSAGLLFSRRWRSQSTFGTPQDDGSIGMISNDQAAYVFYFAGRPVVQFTTGASGPGNGLVYLTADHLGTPVLATDSSGATIWSGGFTPFGAPYQLTPPTLFLRLPGQWTDATWDGLGGGGLYYNVHRWYGAGVGRYEKPDPLLSSGFQGKPFVYADARPIVLSDPFGLCSCFSDCPSGHWDYLGLSVDGGFIGGISTGAGAYRCRGNGRTLGVRFVCAIAGVFAMIGGGVDFSVPGAAPSSCGCNESELLGLQEYWGGSAPGGFVGPGVNVGSCGTKSFSTSTPNVGLSAGAGLFWMRCRYSRL
ncbi:MAG: hypothetical protein ABJC13_05210, partial [Acidobacteriota bacterium]